MTKTKIAFCTEEFDFFSVKNKDDVFEILENGLGRKSIFLMPGKSADFMLMAYNVNKDEMLEYYTSALCAAAFLVTKRGLPLHEIVFETSEGEIKIIHTDTDGFSVKIAKCKQILTLSAELFGCDVKWRDLFVKKRIRAVHTDDISVFSNDVLKRLLLLDGPLPFVTLASSSLKGNLAVRYYSEFNLEALSPIVIYSAAAFNERIISGAAALKLFADGGKISFVAEPFSVTVSARPEII